MIGSVTDRHAELHVFKKAIKIPIAIAQKEYQSEGHLMTEMIDLPNKALRNILEFKANVHQCIYFNFFLHHYHIYRNHFLSQLLHMTNVLTSYDDFHDYALDYTYRSTLPPDGACYVILIPTEVAHDIIRVNDKNELLTALDLVQLFRERVTDGNYTNLILSLNERQTDSTLSQIDQRTMAVFFNET